MAWRPAAWRIREMVWSPLKSGLATRTGGMATATRTISWLWKLKNSAPAFTTPPRLELVYNGHLAKRTGPAGRFAIRPGKRAANFSSTARRTLLDSHPSRRISSNPRLAREGNRGMAGWWKSIARPMAWPMCAALWLGGCSAYHGSNVASRAMPASAVEPVPEASAPGRVTVASWYGPGFVGQRTASGEIYRRDDLTAASRSLPLGTRVRVTNLGTGRAVVVRIND